MTNNKLHFEDLWEQSENFHKDTELNESTSNIIEELMYKITLYKALDAKTEIPEEDRQKAKSRTMGEILLTLTNLSLKDNINVFDALGVALQFRSVGFYNKKHA